MLVEFATGRHVFHKLRSNSADPATAILDGTRAILALAGLAEQRVDHLGLGTILATHAVIERKCGPTALLTRRRPRRARAGAAAAAPRIEPRHAQVRAAGGVRPCHRPAGRSADSRRIQFMQPDITLGCLVDRRRELRLVADECPNLYDMLLLRSRTLSSVCATWGLPRRERPQSVDRRADASGWTGSVPEVGHLRLRLKLVRSNSAHGISRNQVRVVPMWNLSHRLASRRVA